MTQRYESATIVTEEGSVPSSSPMVQGDLMPFLTTNTWYGEIQAGIKKNHTFKYVTGYSCMPKVKLNR